MRALFFGCYLLVLTIPASAIGPGIPQFNLWHFGEAAATITTHNPSILVSKR
jgi:hypothetical protein